MADAVYDIIARNATGPGFAAAASDAEGFAGRVNRAFSRIATPAGAAAAGVGALGSALVAANRAAQNAREINRLSTLANVGAESFQEWARVGRLVGASTDDISDALREMQLRQVEARELGTGPWVDTMRLLNLEFADLQDLAPEDQFALIRDRLAEVEDGSERLFLAEELLGGSTERLHGLLSLTNDELAELREQTADGIIPQETIDRLSTAAQNQERFNQALGDFTTNVGIAVVDTAVGIAESVGAITQALGDLIALAGGVGATSPAGPGGFSPGQYSTFDPITGLSTVRGGAFAGSNYRGFVPAGQGGISGALSGGLTGRLGARGSPGVGTFGRAPFDILPQFFESPGLGGNRGFAADISAGAPAATGRLGTPGFVDSSLEALIESARRNAAAGAARASAQTFDEFNFGLNQVAETAAEAAAESATETRGRVRRGVARIGRSVSQVVTEAADQAEDAAEQARELARRANEAAYGRAVVQGEYNAFLRRQQAEQRAAELDELRLTRPVGFIGGGDTLTPGTAAFESVFGEGELGLRNFANRQGGDSFGLGGRSAGARGASLRPGARAQVAYNFELVFNIDGNVVTDDLGQRVIGAVNEALDRGEVNAAPRAVA